ncbi:LpqN/LpqT family lipoprotein [Mycobacterium sp. SMC-4]|uniref:LpqN/LpqT family lipoprotein n=1 Tax=Mycobacterium sp. SMC-4 TaxID=2857059 RepID=UPI003D00C936
MSEIARRWRVLAGGVGACAAGVAGVLTITGTTAGAQPMPVLPAPAPAPAAATVTQTVTVTPNAAPAPVVGQTPAVTGGAAAVPAGVSAPVVPPRPPTTIAPASSGTLTEFFAAKGVTMQPQSSRDFRALNIVLPMPRGWQHIPDPNVPDAFAVIADRVGGNGLYTSNAQLVVYRLIGEFDPKEAISHGFVDSHQLPAWRTTDASLADFGGMPSALIEGTYRENNMTLNTSRRHVIATAGPDRYLVSLAVTTSVDQVVAAADATDAIVNGFKVGLPSAAPAAAPPPPGAPLPPAPAAPAVPAVPAAPAAPAPAQALGLQG